MVSSFPRDRTLLRGVHRRSCTGNRLHRPRVLFDSRSTGACGATIGLVAPDDAGSAGRASYEESGFNVILREFFHHYSSDLLGVLLGFVVECNYTGTRTADLGPACVCVELFLLDHFVG